MKIWMVIGAAALAAAALFAKPASAPQEAEEPAVDKEDQAETATVRASIRHVKHDMDPVTLKGWTRLVCDCEDGVERKMTFEGATGVYMTDGEKGLLEHRDGVFVSFTKDSGEVITPMYRLLPQDADGVDGEGEES